MLARCPKCRVRVAEEVSRCPHCRHDLLGDIVVLEAGEPTTPRPTAPLPAAGRPRPPVARTVVGLVAMLGAAFSWVADGVGRRPPTVPSSTEAMAPLREPTRTRLLAVVGGQAWVLDVDAPGPRRALPVALPPGGIRVAVERARGVVAVVGERAVAILGPGRLVDLGPADHAFPAADADRVWLGHGGSVREVATTTATVVRGPHAVDAFAAVGDGLLVHDERGALYVDADTATPARLYPGLSIVVGAAGPWLVTADRHHLHCNIVAVELARSARRRGPLVPYRSCFYGRAVLSPGGALLALPVAEPIQPPGAAPAGHAALFVVDVAGAAAHEVPGARRPEASYRSLTWAPSGRWLFWADRLGPHPIAAYRVGSAGAVAVDTSPLPPGPVTAVWAMG